ncbi:MAG: hypothetical protein IJW29_02190 [Clostridia bacterium]|nr:hypothetical protein [Clostridia bacterium]
MAKVKIDMSKVSQKLDQITTNDQLGVFAAEQGARIMEKYVPMDSGQLIASARTDEPWKVTYDTPYARRLYHGKGFNFSKEKHPAAKAYWDKGPRWATLAKLITEKLRSM